MPEVTSPTALDRHRLTWDGLLFHDEGDELPLGAGLLHAAKRLDACEVRLEGARPPEAGRDRVGRRRDVVPVQRVADLEAQRVSGAEAARRDATLENRVPQLGAVLGRAEELHSRLAGVPGAADHRFDARDLAHRMGERRCVGQPEPLERLRALDRDERVVVGRVAYLGPACLAILQPRVRVLSVACVDDEQIVTV